MKAMREARNSPTVQRNFLADSKTNLQPIAAAKP